MGVNRVIVCLKQLRENMNCRCWSVVALLLMPSAAFASGGSITPAKIFQDLINLLTGTLGHVVAVAAIVFIGYQTLHAGKMSKEKATGYLLGVGLIFGGPIIFQQLGG